jgi:Tol biopolymer transport system component/predicted Ser/Thr protein kinase
MSLSAGDRIGAFEVLARLGEGGMGEVYRARDTRLGRDVALKVLPDAVARDPERLARFEREARTLAALNHACIAQVYGFEHGALVMELVEGEDLSQRLGRGALSWNEARPLARSIATGLEFAHERGIVHRDLKPANVKVTPEGAVKILDFGLSKALSSDSSAADVMNSPTLTAHATADGLILGTAAYMAPEQARGRPVDRRADIWAFGVVLVEMLTGRKLFDGESVSDIVAAVLTRPIDLTSVPGDVPPRVRELIARCLDRDPARRLRDIGEARIALEDAAGESVPQSRDTRAETRRRWRAGWGLAGMLALAAAAVAGWWFGSRGVTATGGLYRVAPLTDQAGEETAPAISPDGASLAYASRARGSWDIYVQRVGGRNPIVVAGDPARDESAPAFSPDGVSIAFHESDADGGIFIVGATGESARRLTDAGFHPSWSPDGRQIVFCTEEIDRPYSRQTTSSLWTVAVTGGEPQKLFDGDAAQPAWSPSGARIAFWSATRGQRDIWTIAASGGAPVPVTSDAALDWCPVWSPDGAWLYFASDRGGAMNLWRIGVDRDSGTPQGDPEPVTLGVQTAMEQPAISKDGARLVFRSRLLAANPAAFTFDAANARLGAPRLLFRRTAVLVPSGVSPDGNWLALGNPSELHEDVFICRTDGTDLRRLTDDPARDRVAKWSTDGAALIFYSNRGGAFQIWTVGRDGGGLRQLTEHDRELFFPLYSSASDRVVASMNIPGGPLVMFDPRRPWRGQEVVVLPIDLPDGGSFAATGWSPDGRRLTGRVMNRAGVATSFAVYDIEARAMTTMGSLSPDFPTDWLPDSRRAIGMTGAGQLVLYDVDAGQERIIGMPERVRLSEWSFALSPDGATLYASVVESDSDIWMMELRR